MAYKSTKSVFTYAGGLLSYWGSPENKKILFIVGRNNIKKDQLIMESFIEQFHKKNLTVVCYESRGARLATLLTLSQNYNRIISKILRGFILLRHPRYWSFFIPHYRKKHATIPFQIKALKKALNQLGAGKEITILSRSSGSRISSVIADEMHIQKLICIDYPFKNPDHNVEPERFQHLPHLKTPCLIIQGTRDEYGGFEITQKYQFSPSTKLLFVNATHNFNITDGEWEKIIQQINDFLN